MGMHDNIIVKQNLPLPEDLKNLNINWENYVFQTKNLDNCLLDYFISEDGTLFEHIIEREFIPYSEEEKNKRNYKPWNIWKEVKEKSSRNEKIDYHGSINFYTYDEIDDDNNFWVEFKAYFVYGKLDKIELVEFKLDKERKAYNKKWEEEYKKRSKHPWNIFKHYASYLGWRYFWRRVLKLIQTFSKILDSINYFIIRNLL